MVEAAAAVETAAEEVDTGEDMGGQQIGWPKDRTGDSRTVAVEDAAVDAAGGGGRAQTMKTPYKYFNNKNYCWSCGHDVPDWHTIKTCPFNLQYEAHQEAVTKHNTMGTSTVCDHKRFKPSNLEHPRHQLWLQGQVGRQGQGNYQQYAPARAPTG